MRVKTAGLAYRGDPDAGAFGVGALVAGVLVDQDTLVTIDIGSASANRAVPGKESSCLCGGCESSSKDGNEVSTSKHDRNEDESDGWMIWACDSVNECFVQSR